MSGAAGADDALKLVETAVAGLASGKGITLSPQQLGELVTDCAAWISTAITNKVKDKAAVDGDAAAEKIISLQTAEAAQKDL